MAKVLIVGCGYVGSHLAERLTVRGHAVWGARRTGEVDLSGVKSIRCDVTRLEELERVPSQLDFVFYAVAAKSADPQSYQSAYVDGLENLLTLFKERKQTPRRIFFTSSTSVYGQSDGEWVDEKSPTAPERFTGRIMLQAESVLQNSGFPFTIVRFGGVYGPGRARLIQEVLSGRAIIRSGQPVYTNRVHVEDCAGILFHLMNLESPEAIYLGVDHEPADRNDVYRWLAKRLNVRLPESDVSQQPEKRLPSSNKRCDNGRVVSTGYRFKYPSFREGYGEILRSMGLTAN